MQSRRSQYLLQPHKNTLGITLQTACSSVACYVSVLSICLSKTPVPQRNLEKTTEPKCKAMSQTCARHCTRTPLSPTLKALYSQHFLCLQGEACQKAEPYYKTEFKDPKQRCNSRCISALQRRLVLPSQKKTAHCILYCQILFQTL